MSHLDAVAWVHQLMQNYGLWVLFGMVFLESAGLPLPGETALVTAALYAGTTHQFSLFEVVVVATAGAIIGDTLGYFIGRTLGMRLLVRYGKYVHLTERRLKIGEYLFLRHGGKIVFFGRFIALLRILAALLAGANRMPWPRFAIMNAAGGLGWATTFATAAYVFGDRMAAVERPIGIGLLAIAVVGIFIALLIYRRYENEIEKRAMEHLSSPVGNTIDHPSDPTY